MRVAVVGGDGIGPEVIAAGCRVLDAVAAADGFDVDRVDLDVGAQRYLATGELLTDDDLAVLRGVDAIYFGAIGARDVAPGVLEHGVVIRLRQEFDLYVNLRPIRLLDGAASPIRDLTPERCDLVIVRENTAGGYTQAGETRDAGTPDETAIQHAVETRAGVERLVRYGFELARDRRGRVALCHKTNVLTHTGGLWGRVFADVAAEHPDVETEVVHADAMCLFLVTRPERFDVVVTDNLFGDLISDLGAAVAGGLGLAPSANLDPERRGPSLFEPIHGSAPDIAGTGRADPVGAILSLALLLDHVGQQGAARRVERAVAQVVRERAGAHESRTTDEVGERVARLAAE